MRVELALGPFDTRHDVLRGELDRGADLEHALPVPQRRVDQPFRCRHRSRRTRRPRPRTEAYGWRGGRGEARRAAPRRRGSGARDSSGWRAAAGIVDTCVLRIVSRRRWNSPPSGSDTSLLPYHEATRTVPSWASKPNAERSASGLPDASITSGTGEDARPAEVRAVARSSCETVSTPSPARASRRHARGSTATTRAPARWSMSAVRAPTTPRPSTTTVSPRSGPASRVICNAVSTSGKSVACRGVDGAERDDVAGLRDERVLVRLEGEDQRALRQGRTGSPRRRRRSCTRSGTGTGTCRRVRRCVSSSGSSGSSSPRYANISVPALMPENEVRTSTSPSSSGEAVRTAGCRPTRGDEPQRPATRHRRSLPSARLRERRWGKYPAA